jgi:hypothetical protein
MEMEYVKKFMEQNMSDWMDISTINNSVGVSQIDHY